MRSKNEGIDVVLLRMRSGDDIRQPEKIVAQTKLWVQGSAGWTKKKSLLYKALIMNL